MLALIIHGAATDGCMANFVVKNVDYPWTVPVRVQQFEKKTLSELHYAVSDLRSLKKKVTINCK